MFHGLGWLGREEYQRTPAAIKPRENTTPAPAAAVMSIARLSLKFICGYEYLTQFIDKKMECLRLSRGVPGDERKEGA